MTQKLKQNLELFAKYVKDVSKCDVLRVWVNDNNFYAQIDGIYNIQNVDFSDIFQGGTVVKLAFSDLENQNILKNRVIFKK